MYTYNKGPEVLRDPKKSTKLCPLTRHYCTKLCAMAVPHEDLSREEWVCGLIIQNVSGVRHVTVRYVES